MTDVKKHMKVIRYFLALMVFTSFSRTNINLEIPKIIIFVLLPLLIINDIYRIPFKNKDSYLYYLSLALSIIGVTVLKFFINNIAINIYMFFYIMEILYFKNLARNFFLVFHVIFYLLSIIVNIKTSNNTEWLETFGTNLLTYLSVICILYLSHDVRVRREETKNLNEELKSSNIKLQEYALKVEELTINKERERVAQELHDSLGHSLMALTMHLEFAYKVFHSKPEKAEEAILKAYEISKDSTHNLRIAVNTLKKERDIKDLGDAIKELIDGFQVLGNINIDFNFDKTLETLNPDIKLCIYKTIRESITNGLKHGNATSFNIEISIDKDCAILFIENNGVSCDNIIKSNGLKGIENRILALGGTVSFNSSKKIGFFINAIIPIYKEVK